MDAIVYFIKQCGKACENLNCRYEGVKFAYFSHFLASRRNDIFAKTLCRQTHACIARKLNSGTFDVRQYAEHSPVIHL